jgi:L-2-hydroxyglutarate oxidase LhgO
LHVPGAAIVSYSVVAQKLSELIEHAGGTIHLNSPVTSLQRDNETWRISTPNTDFSAKTLINCGGLFCDRLAKLAGATPNLRIVPFRGEYYQLRADRAPLVRGLIYPVPDPRFPFLGVHFTRRIDGTVECGPNAVLALSREGYTRTSFRLFDAADTFAYPGFWRLAMKYWKTGLAEFHRSFSKASFTQALQKLVPAVTADDLVGYGAGVRAQALNRDGTLVDDFQIVKEKGATHILNAPSPAATASLSIAESIVNNLD